MNYSGTDRHKKSFTPSFPTFLLDFHQRFILSFRIFFASTLVFATALCAQKPGVLPVGTPAPSSAAVSAPSPVNKPAVVPGSAVAPPDLRVERLPSLTDSVLQRKLDSLSKAAEAAAAIRSEAQTDSAAKATAAEALQAIRDGKYVSRANYDQSNFDHWKVDTVYQKKMKEVVAGDWRTELLAHGHAFRDDSRRFAMNDTLYGVTRTYSDSGRYQMTGEYKFQARYRFDNDTSMVSREVFLDRHVVRWDYIQFKVADNRLSYHLSKLEFRDLNDNWLNAVQGFEHVSPELYLRAPVAASAPATIPAK